MKTLQERKPLVAKKIEAIPDRVAQGKSIALLQAHIDYRCPLRCSFCSITKFRENISEPMSMETLKIVADQADAYQLSSFCISGGEPLTYPNLEEIIDTIGSSRFILSMDTNGMFLNEDKIVWLVEKGVDRIHLSIDGLEETHTKTRGKGGLWKHNIEMLPLCKKHNLGVVVNIVAVKDLVRSGEIEKQLEFLQPLGHHCSMIFPKPVGSFEESKDQILNTKDMDYLELLTKKYNCSTHLTPSYGRDMGCLAVKRHFSVLPDSRVMSCPWIPISWGSILEEGLDTILTRMLKSPWHKWGLKNQCMSGNIDSFFYQNVLPQVYEQDEYPADYRNINFYEEYFNE